MEIVEQTDISAPEAKKVLEKRKKERDLVYEQKICLELLDKAAKISSKKFKKMVEELQEISILRPRHIALIANIMPDTEDEVKIVFSKERTNLKKEEITKIAEIVKKYKK